MAASTPLRLMSELEQLRSIYEPLAQSVRRLIDGSIRTQADEATVRSAISKIDCAAEELKGPSVQSELLGLQHSGDGQVRIWGNVVMGVRNPIALPLVVHHDADGSVWAEFM